MNKNTQIIIVLLLLIVENIAVFYIADLYQQNKRYNTILEAKQGLVEACKQVVISESLTSILEKLKDYFPTITTSSGYIHLNYGTVISGGVAVSLLFDKNYNLTHKNCGHNWEPDTPNL